MLATGFAINQMVLHVAGSTVRRQREVFIITSAVVTLLQVLPSIALWSVFALRSPADYSSSLVIAVIGYTATFNLAELTRQFLYMRRRQRLSVIFAATSTSLGTLAFLLTVFMLEPTSALAPAFWYLTLIQGGYVLAAAVSGRAWRFARAPSKEETRDTLQFYWQHGKFAAAGMTVTWAQNKSVTPMLVLTMGNVAAGVYQIARMIITPINVITIGLARSALAHIRRAWGDGNEQALKQAIAEQLRASMIVVASYLVIAYLVLFTLKATNLVELPQELFLIFVATTVVVVLSNYRFWISRRHAVQLRFAFLLSNGCIAAVLALLWMWTSGTFWSSAALVVLGSAIGEAFLIAVLRTR